MLLIIAGHHKACVTWHNCGVHANMKYVLICTIPEVIVNSNILHDEFLLVNMSCVHIYTILTYQCNEDTVYIIWIVVF